MGNTATVIVNGQETKNVKIKNPAQALSIQGNIVPGENIDLSFSLNDINLKFSELMNVEKVNTTVTNSSNRETENITFTRKDEDTMSASIPTVPVNRGWHWDVILLIIIFAATMLISQKIMMAMNNTDNQDPTQAALQKSMGTFMPLMIIATFVFIPIPAGVLLYLITSNIVQIFQTIIINKQIDAEEAKKKESVEDLELKNAKKVN